MCEPLKWYSSEVEITDVAPHVAAWIPKKAPVNQELLHLKWQKPWQAR